MLSYVVYAPAASICCRKHFYWLVHASGIVQTCTRQDGLLWRSFSKANSQTVLKLLSPNRGEVHACLSVMWNVWFKSRVLPICKQVRQDAAISWMRARCEKFSQISAALMLACWPHAGGVTNCTGRTLQAFWNSYENCRVHDSIVSQIKWGAIC